MNAFAALILLAALTLTSVGQIKKPEPPPVKPPFSESLQAVVVTTKEWTATRGTARLYERPTKTSEWRSKGDSFPVVVGRTGLGHTKDGTWTASATFVLANLKREGDGRSPAGMFPLTFVFGSAAKNSQLRFPYLNSKEQRMC